jgi:NAD(P)-dependent dehydrogenase (short-subunit alcohol dehydrogenase family)
MTDRESWIEQHVPALTGRVAVVTGATSGLGFETSRVLAQKGAHVVLAVRNPDKGEGSAKAIRASVPGASLEVLLLDLADLAAIRAFVQTYLASHNRLDILLNNAGVMALPYRKTVDGFEMQFGTNHLGHFALTGLLAPLILRTLGARVVTVSSAAHSFGRIRFDDLNGERSYRKWSAYGQSKLANLLFAYELQRRLAAAGSSAISVAAHPGYASTNLQFAGPEMEGSRFSARMVAVANRVIGQSAAMGALPEIYAATSPQVRGGDYIGPDGFMEQNGFPKKVKSNARSHDEAAAARLWEVSEQLTRVRFPLR